MQLVRKSVRRIQARGWLGEGKTRCEEGDFCVGFGLWELTLAR